MKAANNTTPNIQMDVRAKQRLVIALFVHFGGLGGVSPTSSQPFERFAVKREYANEREFVSTQPSRLILDLPSRFLPKQKLVSHRWSFQSAFDTLWLALNLSSRQSGLAWRRRRSFLGLPELINVAIGEHRRSAF
jgi:hypothetical protein